MCPMPIEDVWFRLLRVHRTALACILMQDRDCHRDIILLDGQAHLVHRSLR